METKIGVELLKEMRANGIIGKGKFSETMGSLVFPMNHNVDVRDLKQPVLRKGFRYYFHVKFNSMDLVVF